MKLSEKIDKLKKYSPVVLRFGLAIVFLWFGFSQLKNPELWTGLLPGFLNASVSFIYLNAIFEIIFAFLLMVGLFTRIVSFILGLHLIGIIFSLGYGAVAVRDVGLAIATFSIFLHGADEFCLDILIKKKKHHEHNSEMSHISE